jgi:DNA-binding HxlR family transcriptional regulator
MENSQLCPRFEKAMNIISQRWSGLIIYQLLNGGPQRFSEIEASLPISGRVLSDRLKDLEQFGIVKRDVFPETPVRIEYSLSEKGHALQPVLKSIEKWSHDWVSVDE